MLSERLEMEANANNGNSLPNDRAPVTPPVTVEDAVKAAAFAIVDAMLDLLQEDGHQWSKRPCSTCQAITSLRGKSFGCVKYAEERR